MTGSPVLVAMSGGLDSAVAAALLLQEGCDIVGVTLEFWHEGSDSPAADAKDLCAHLGVSHITIDARQRFYNRVVAPFVYEYSRARTPNPCVYCNPSAKFGVLLDVADRLGYGSVATGHYARLVKDEKGWGLYRGADSRKDQSYFLHRLRRNQLDRILFPLGDITKENARRLALEIQLPNAQKDESQDLCFACDGDYRRFVASRSPNAFRPGPILDVEGDELGTHSGLANYTIGQRGGLGISAPAALYVLELDPVQNAVIVGYADQLGRIGLIARDMQYLADLPADGARLLAQIRYQGRPSSCTYHDLGQGMADIQFDEKLRDITPGQAVVLYRGAQVIGGGIIQSSR